MYIMLRRPTQPGAVYYVIYRNLGCTRVIEKTAWVFEKERETWQSNVH